MTRYSGNIQNPEMNRTLRNQLQRSNQYGSVTVHSSISNIAVTKDEVPIKPKSNGCIPRNLKGAN